MKDHKNEANHRPISLLNSLSKLLERIIEPRLNRWVKESKILSKFQSGFRAHHQTADHIIRLLQEGVETTNQDKYMGVLFVDLASAFDKVWHNGLLYKLHQYNIPNHLGYWIKNYLSNRKGRIKIGEVLSDLFDILAGVPQGSVLGPILFIIFFNDIHNIITERTTLGTYADDLTSWVINKHLKILKNELQKQLTSIHEWSFKWHMKVNAKKTNYIVIHRGTTNHNLNLNYNNELIQNEPNPKFLGVTLDKNLFLNKHAEILISRAQKRINMIRRIRGQDWGIDNRLTMITYKVLIRSIFDYAPMAQLALANTNINKIETIQRKAIRMVTHWAQDKTATEIYKEITTQYKLEPIKTRILQLVDNYIGKANMHHEVIINLIQEYNRATHVREGSLLRRKQKPKMTILGRLKVAQSKFTSQLIKPAPYPCPAQLHDYYHCNTQANNTIKLIFGITAIIAILLSLFHSSSSHPRQNHIS